MNGTCDFCRTIFKPEQLSSSKYAKRTSYCRRSCPLKKHEPRYNHVITPECQEFMKGIFESFVADGERGVTVFGVKTFDTLYKEIYEYYPYLTDVEYVDLLDIMQEFEEKYGKYVDLVLNQTKFMEIASSGGAKPLKTPADWASAIRNLNRILFLTNQSIDLKLESFLNKKAVERRKRACHKLSRLQCRHPCVLKSGVMGKVCTYQAHTKYNK